VAGGTLDFFIYDDCSSVVPSYPPVLSSRRPSSIFIATTSPSIHPKPHSPVARSIFCYVASGSLAPCKQRKKMAVPEVVVEGVVFPPVARPPGSAGSHFLGGAGALRRFRAGSIPCQSVVSQFWWCAEYGMAATGC